MSFESLGLAESLVRAVHDKGYTQPTPIQTQAIPAILQGQDIMAAAQTGTGKTAGFTLPLLQRLLPGQPVKANGVRALVLTPTRELAAQVYESVQVYGENLPLRSTVVFGGVSINPQMKNLRRGVDVLVATPGRLLDLHKQNAVKLNQVEILVLDEADRMLDMGFIHDIKRVLALLPAKRQNLLFSATFSGDIRELARGLLNNPVEIDVAPRNSTTELVEQVVHPVDKGRKAALLSHLIKSQDWTQAIVFSRTKHGANRLVDYLMEDGISAAAIHSNKSQGARTKALSEFKNGKVSILVATDIAARGLDIPQLPQVVNFDLPNVPEDYVHRIGRTGRAGETGHAISLVSADESRQLADIERLIKRKITREEITGFEAKQTVAEARTEQPQRRNESRGGGRSGQQRQGQQRQGQGVKDSHAVASSAAAKDATVPAPMAVSVTVNSGRPVPTASASRSPATARAATAIAARVNRPVAVAIHRVAPCPTWTRH
ncbi:MAG: DEAD/DEAH box helicase [Gammaproteobacteria bacterium]